MAGLSAYSVPEGNPNSPPSTRAMSNSSISYRSSSAKLSIRSSRSRITLVGHDASLEPEVDVPDGTTSNVRGWSRFDHLLAVFCINRRPTPAVLVSERRADPEDREIRLDRSPWVLPVYVLSRERDEYRHLVPKEAKCTIDTGNLQGNIVSKAFLVDVLGYSEADFQKLTKDEEDGGTGITGHTLIPEGAINLTWYHANSTKVFRDMRFLISEHPMYDLIIGARTIRRYNILDVPNLMTEGREDLPPAPTTPDLDALEETKNAKFQVWNGAKTKAAEELAENGSVSSETKTARTESKKEFEEAKEKFEGKLEHFYRGKVQAAKTKGESTSKDKKKELPKEIQKEIQNIQEWFQIKTDRELSLKEKDQ